MKQFGLQLYTVRNGFEELGLEEAMRRVAEAGYSYGQTAGYFDSVPTAQVYADAAKKAGLGICGTHYSWDKIVGETEETMEVHNILGTKNIGIGGMPGWARETEEGIKRFIDESNEVAAKLAKQGFKFTYHNHSFEFKRINGKTMMDYLIEGFDPANISFVLDTYWVQHGGYDVRKMIERLAGRIDILHLKDMGACRSYTLEGGSAISAPYITEIGAGNINFEDIIPLAEKTGVGYFVVEQDTNFATGDCFESIKTSADYIKANLLG